MAHEPDSTVADGAAHAHEARSTVSDAVAPSLEHEEDARSAERYELLGRIAGGIAHDLNNALSTVTTFADLLLARTEPGSRVAGDLAEIKDAGVAAAAITRRLQLFANSDRRPPEDIGLGEVLGSVESLLARLLRPNVSLEVRVDERCPPVHAPRARVEEVLVALAAGARSSDVEGGTLRITARPGPPLASTSGRASAVLEAAYPESGRRGAARGNPLGLAASLVSELGGRLEAASVTGGGTVVRVVLPGAEQD